MKSVFHAFWAVKNQHVEKMGMLYWMSGKTRRIRIKNDTIRERELG